MNFSLFEPNLEKLIYKRAVLAAKIEMAQKKLQRMDDDIARIQGRKGIPDLSKLDDTQRLK